RHLRGAGNAVASGGEHRHRVRHPRRRPRDQASGPVRVENGMSAAGLTAVATERASSVLADLRDFRRRISPHPELYAESAKALPVISIAAIAFVGLFPLFGSNDWILKLQEGLYFGLLALSLNILVGSAGMVSFGHAMFLGIGAYTIAIPFRDHNINPL